MVCQINFIISGQRQNTSVQARTEIPWPGVMDPLKFSVAPELAAAFRLVIVSFAVLESQMRYSIF